MLLSKQVADLLTLSRIFLSVAFAWLGLGQAAAGLPLAAWMLIVSWTSDTLDGPLARRSRVQYQTWIGDHDLEVDMAVAGGLMIYMVLAGFVEAILGIVYLLLWVLYFLRYGIPRSLGMTFQAPIYGWFIVVALRDAPAVGIWLVAWILILMVVTWPKFPNEIVPDFLSGIRNVFKGNGDTVEKV